MKTRIVMFALSVLAGWLALPVHAQVILPLHSFYDSDNGTNGIYPEGRLVVGPDGNFYGTTYWGGTGNTNLNGGYGGGTVFRLTPDGGFTTLVQFNGTNGTEPKAALAVGADGYLYGTTQYGGGAFGDTSIFGGNGGGTVFRIDTNGNFTLLASFFKTNGAAPLSSLTLGPDGNLYGTTSSGGDYLDGTIFRITPGGNLTVLTNFNNSNGNGPVGGLTFGPDGYLYGTTQNGGTNGFGTVFRVAINGTSLTTLFHFGGSSTKGVAPKSTLIPGPDGAFYGSTESSRIATTTNIYYIAGYGYITNIFTGPSGNGTIYRLTTNGELTTVADLDDYSEGINPVGNLALGPDGNIYGATYQGGDYNYGTIFRVATNGNFTTLITLNADNGAWPETGLTLGPDNDFYGTVTASSDASGVLFKLGLPPELIASPADQSAIIGNSANFGCQLFGTTPFTYQWSSNSVSLLTVTNSSLTVAPVSWPANNAWFQVVVTNDYGSVTSQVATLNVVLQPNSYAVSNNGDGSFTVFMGSNPDSTNQLWTTTDLTLPRAQWQLIDTIIMDTNGLGQFLDMNVDGSPQKYYQLSLP